MDRSQQYDEREFTSFHDEKLHREFFVSRDKLFNLQGKQHYVIVASKFCHQQFRELDDPPTLLESLINSISFDTRHICKKNIFAADSRNFRKLQINFRVSLPLKVSVNESSLQTSCAALNRRQNCFANDEIMMQSNVALVTTFFILFRCVCKHIYPP